MSFCFTIQVTAIPSGTPSHFLTDGMLFVDLSDKESAARTIKAPVLKNGKISNEAIFGFSIPKTPKNVFLFQHFTNPAVSRGSAVHIPVLVQQGGAALIQDLFSIVGENYRNQTYETQLLRSNSHWLNAASSLYLNTIDLGKFNFSASNVIQVQENEAQFADGQSGIYFPLVNYGEFSKTDDHIVEDFRVWHHTCNILKAGFCAIGWNIEADIFFNTEWGKRQIAYLADSNYGRKEGQLSQREFRGYTNIDDPNFTSLNTFFDLNFTQEVYDNGGNFNPDNGEFTGIGVHDFFFHFVFTVHAAGFQDGATGTTDRTFTLTVVQRYADGAENNFDFPITVAVPNNESLIQFTIDGDLSQLTVIPGTTIRIKLYNPAGASLQIDNIQGYFFNKTTNTSYIAGDSIIIADTIASGLSLLDFIKGAMHLGNLRAYTDFGTKTVTFFPPYDVRIYEDANLTEGYYRPFAESLDWSNVIECESKQAEISNISINRYYQLEYANNSDPFITKRRGENADPLHFKKLDYGEQYREKTDKDQNPLFAVSLSEEKNRTTTENRQAVDMLHLLDNLEGNVSYDVGYRVAIAFGDYESNGNTLTKELTDGSQGILGYSFDGVERPVPYAFMTTDYLLNGLPITLNLKYGEDADGRDIYSYFYKRDLYARFQNLSIKYGAFLNVASFQALDFRTPVYVNDNGVPFLARIEKVEGFDVCFDDMAKVLLLPESGLIGNCVNPFDLPQTKCLDNKPNIQTSLSQNSLQRCVTPSIGGTQGATTSELLEFSTDGGETWTMTGQGIEVCFAQNVKSVLFRYSAQYPDSECREKSIVEYIDLNSLCNNIAAIETQYNESNNCITAYFSGNIQSTILTDAITYNLDGGQEIDYTPGDEVCNIGTQTITFTRTTTYGDCPASVVSASFTPQPPICSHSLEIDCIDTGGFLTFAITGTSTAEIYGQTFMTSEGGADFTPWNGQPIACAPDLIVRATIHLCDCEDVCLEKLCPCSDCVETFHFGEAVKVSICR